MPPISSPHLSAMLIGLGVVSAAQAQPNMGAEHLSINAKTDFSSMQAGQSGLLAIDIIVEDGWHTYWPGISDTGYGITFDINAPGFVEIKDPIWPTPKRYLQKGGILDHTYEGTQTVLFPFVIRDDASASSVVFNIDANFLVCDDMCLPGRDEDTVSVEIVSNEQRPSATSEHDEIKKIFESRAKPFNTNDMSVRLQWIEGAAAIMFRDATRIEFYPDSECTPIKDLIKDGAADGNRLEVYFSESEDLQLSGRVRVTTRKGDEFYNIVERAP